MCIAFGAQYDLVCDGPGFLPWEVSFLSDELYHCGREFICARSSRITRGAGTRIAAPDTVFVGGAWDVPRGAKFTAMEMAADRTTAVCTEAASVALSFMWLPRPWRCLAVPLIRGAKLLIVFFILKPDVLL